MKFTRLLGFCCLCACWANPGWAVDGNGGRPLPAKHVKAGVTCFDCHEAEHPKAATSSMSCMNCHGDMPAMADVTRKLPVNPHAPPPAPHPGPFVCTDCHHQHQAPAVKCLECHPKFKFNAV